MNGNIPIVVIIDFTLVVGMDSSAAHAVAKLKKIVHRLFGVEVSIFVTGSDRGGFPCEYALSQALCPEAAQQVEDAGIDWNDMSERGNENDKGKKVSRGSISVSPGTLSVKASKVLTHRTDGQVCESLDEALQFAEDILIARENPDLAKFRSRACIDVADLARLDMSLDEERYHAKKYLRELFTSSIGDTNEGILVESVDILISLMERKEYVENEALWQEGDDGESLQLLVFGELLSIIQDTGCTEKVIYGSLVGELGLVHGTKRLTTLLCASEKAVTYVLRKEAWLLLKDEHPEIAQMMDAVVIRYLAHRVQHVSNRYFHTQLPI